MFTSVMTDLSGGTKYYVKAYATNSNGTGYGEQREFTTSSALPVVITGDVTDITATSALCGCNVTSDGQYPVTARGVCWSTSQDPTINGSHTSNGSGTGEFTASITGLISNTTYYVRAYATNKQGTKYGELKSFTTLWSSEGCINGLFSVSGNLQVYFSQGNLQYQASMDKWRFAENQWDYVGEANANISSGYSGWVDLFGWGTSGYNHGAVCYQPWSTSVTCSMYYAYGDAAFNLYNKTGQADWGYNPISNGGNNFRLWRTLTNEEWDYVVNTRHTNSGIRFAKAKVNGTNGIILLPDNWSNSYYGLTGTNNANANYNANVISASTWESFLESHGAVFLPAAGWRDGASVHDVGSNGNYWSASATDSDLSQRLYFSNGTFNPDGPGSRANGLSVRLVSNKE